MKPQDECGVVGLWGVSEASKRAYLALCTLQHRGQESAGIAARKGSKINVHLGQGLVQDVFTRSTLAGLPGKAAIGHVRYSTAGRPSLENAQPLFADTAHGQIAIAHNGHLVNAKQLRASQKAQGASFRTTIDTEAVLQKLAQATNVDLSEALQGAFTELKGAYSMVVLSKNSLIAARDPNGFRPLVLGKLGKGWVVASETCAFNILGAEYVREIHPGEILVIDKNGPGYPILSKKQKQSLCIFELIYFSRPDSYIFKNSVYQVRLALGRRLAETLPAVGDVVIAVPDSSTAAALGYAEVLELPLRHGLVRSHYIGRTFIEPDEKIRDFGAKIKYNPVDSVVKGQRVIMVDDSVVRGLTSKKIIRMLRKAGAREIHVRISCPPWKFPCNYGIDTPTKEELIGHNRSISEIGNAIGADSIGYLGLKDMLDVVAGQDFCTACFTGDYPVDFQLREAKEIFEK